MSKRQLGLGTVSFAICFAAWGLISAFAPRFREMLHLTASQTALLIAVPRPAGIAGPHSDGPAHRPLQGASGFHGADAVRRDSAFAGILGQFLFDVDWRSVPDGNGWIVLRGGRGICIALVQGRSAGGRPGSVWTGEHRPIRRGVSWPRAGCLHRHGQCVPGALGTPAGVGGGLLPGGAQRARGSETEAAERDAGAAGTRTPGLGPVGVLLSHFWRIRRVFDLPAQPS